MGIFETLRLTPSVGLTTPTAIASPWAEGSLATVVWSDIFGDDVVVPLTRAEAMTVPAINRARDLICATAMRLPLLAMDATGPLSAEKQPTWMYRTDGGVSPQMRTVWTLDDLLFYGASLWSVARGTEGQILSAERIPYEWWQVTPEGGILVNGAPVNAREVVYFPSHTDALLTAGATTIRSARSVAKSVERRAASPVPVMELHHVDPDTPVTAKEAKEYVAAYNKARRDPEGATVFTPNHIEMRPHGDKADAGALTEARNAARLDIANHTGVPASLLEGSSAGASLTYVTTEGKRSEFLEYGVLPWIESFIARLSMDDVLPRGQRAVLDLDILTATTPSATGAERQD